MSAGDAHRAANRRALLIFVGALALVVIATGFVVGALQARFLREEAHTRFETELRLLGELAVEPLLRADYAAVERLIQAWVERHPHPLAIQAIAPNGFELLRAQNRDAPPTALQLELPVSFAGKPLLILRAAADVSGRESIVSGIARNAALLSVALVTLFGWVLWGTLQRTAIRPLETEIAARVRQENALRQRTVELEHAIRELETFSYSVSHDLRAPLRAIDGFSAVIEEDYARQLAPQGREYLGRIRSAAQRMGLLIDDLLSLAHTSHQALRPADVDLGALARECLARHAEREPGRPVEVRIADGLHARVDRALMTVALENLLGNAWKYTARRPHAVIEFGAEQRDGETVYRVRDNGTGFDMRYYDKLFQPFHRLHGSDFPGSGIGLAIVQRVIQRHGGHLWAESEPGHGATFLFTLGALPDAPVEPDPATPPAGP